MELFSDSWKASLPFRCNTCKEWISQKADHDVSKHLPDVPQSRGTMMAATNFVKVSDELVEHSSVFVTEDGNVTITAAHYKALMSALGWRQR